LHPIIFEKYKKQNVLLQNLKITQKSIFRTIFWLTEKSNEAFLVIFKHCVFSESSMVRNVLQQKYKKVVKKSASLKVLTNMMEPLKLVLLI